MLKIAKLFLIVAVLVGGIAAFKQATMTDHRGVEYAIRDTDYTGSQR